MTTTYDRVDTVSDDSWKVFLPKDAAHSLGVLAVLMPTYTFGWVLPENLPEICGGSVFKYHTHICESIEQILFIVFATTNHSHCHELLS